MDAIMVPYDAGPKMKCLRAFAAALLFGVPAAEAEICALDDRPGATLLLPYFEVDLGNPNGLTTFFTVHNTSAEPALTRVVLWTDAAFATFGFPMFLEGYDLQAINLRDVFAGKLPPWPAEEPPCDGAAPPGPDTGFLEAAHTGRPSPRLEGLCAGFGDGDEIARGYVTVDVVSGCADLLPTDEGYFGEGGVAAYDDVLWGDFFYFNPASRRSEGGLMVSLEAERDALGPGDTTFYGRYVGASAADAREPLPTLWSNRFLGGGPLNITSRSIVWRDTGAPPEAFDCAGGPSWHPLPFVEVISFDEQGNPVFLTTDVAFVVEPEPPFPAATQLGAGFRAFAFGWEIVDLNPSPAERRQSFMMELVEADGGASYMRRATPLDDGCSLSGCAFGETTDAGRVCIFAESGAEPPVLEPGEPISFRFFPRGCFSSTCTIPFRSACTLKKTDAGLDAETGFCLRDLRDEGAVCSEDCGGGGFAECSLREGLPAGAHVLRLGTFEVAFSVPMELPAEGLCVDLDDFL